GVGAKTAQRIVIDLKDKVSLSDEAVISSLKAGNKASGATGGEKLSGEMEDAVSALAALGYSITESRKAVCSVEGVSEMDSGSILSAALKLLY
ncbi:MAG: Holliday junction branch migration protein RuvA, partial [Lachnospiraceae bacterium]|nr:Holliday junction branch migration protein RuvA [Lachnospiraceae bacterium]